MKHSWTGRFASGSHPAFDAFQKSLPVDRRLWREDVAVNRAWAAALARAGVLREEERGSLERALDLLERELDRDPSALAASDAEDVHTHVESRLTALAGDAGKKIHTGRSRNDQVATDFRLYAKSATLELEAAIASCARALAASAAEHAALAIPGYTHLQRAQPITVGHHLLAYVEMLARDRSRLADARARLDVCPLGSGALAGTAFPIDREALAKDLGFAAPTTNSLDAVSDRDFACEIAFACALMQVHLSRLAEDWIFFSSTEAGFLELSDAVTTGSSLMPQKKNPDGLELVRGKSARAIGRLHALLVMLKGLPLAYDKDLQEDKEGLFDCVDTALASLAMVELAVKNARWNAARCEREAARGFLNATDLCDLLVRRGVPFREAHERTGRAVRTAIELGVELHELPPDSRRALFPELASELDLARELATRAVLDRRSAIGGTAPARVAAEAQSWMKRIESWSTRS